MSGPLSNLLVIDLSRVLAGPYATMVLADLGAQVIKVERPDGGDDSRRFGPFINGHSAYFASINRGKRSIALDLKLPGDRRIFDALLERADVLVDNYRPGVMDRLGYGPAVLKQRFPHLVHAAASGFGHSGPYSHRAAYDMVVQGMGGIMSITGTPDGPPVRVGTSIGDITAGLFTVIGILSALHDRIATGHGQFVDVAMLDGQVAILENAITRYAASGQSPGPLGTRHPSIAPFASFKCADAAIVIAAGNDDLFAALAEAIALPPDPRFATNEERSRNVDVLTEAMEARLATRPAAEWLAILDAAGVPAGPINDIAAMASDPQVKARNMIIETHLPDGTPVIAAGNPVKLSAHPDPRVRAPAPALDGDRDAILKALGLAPLLSPLADDDDAGDESGDGNGSDGD
ncbi:CaiB/BaiF CoA transferase family protein [Sandarakinorhabdus rubra]|uniref:CaiB/BaiF CoA transferase family protein n=1 Tax=Sandarakinorhabdus rubra TaxID=2672568 RepID=UPI0013D9C002|nr:CaiB/BaiF CoA-transferase family protein [Sandarakinorhabdus rubra]